MPRAARSSSASGTPMRTWYGCCRNRRCGSITCTGRSSRPRCPMPAHPNGCGAAHAEALDRAIVEAGPETVAAFVAEPVAGATLGAAVPPDDYWPAIAEVCRRHGVLLIADEVMTGFGRTGRWV